MRIERCHIRAFGRLGDLEIAFGAGLNLVFAANEGGKSTLQRFLVGLLYGQLRADLHTQRRLDAWVDRYRPWQGGEFGGTIWCRLAGGRDFEVRRVFGKDEDRTEIRTGTGEPVEAQYERLRNGELLFAQRHLKLPKDLFESAAIIRENRAGELDGIETLRDRVANLATSGDERVSVRRCLARLEEGLDSIGSERAPTKPLKQALDRLRALQAENQALQARRAEFGSWVAERNRLAAAIVQLEADLADASRVVQAARLREAQVKVRALEEVDAEMDRVRKEVATVGGSPAFPLQLLEELNQAEWSRDELRKRLKENAPAKLAALAQLEALAPEREQLAAYVAPAEAGEADKVTESFVSYLSLSRQSDEAQQAVEELQQAIRQQEAALGDYPPPAVSSMHDWQSLSREASDQEHAAAQQLLALSDRAVIGQHRLAAEQGRRARWAVLGLAAAVLALAPLLWDSRLWREAQTFGRMIAVWIACCAAASLTSFALGWASHRKTARLQESLEILESERTAVRDTPCAARVRLLQAAAESGYENVTAFLSACGKASELRRRVSDLQARLQEAEACRRRLGDEALQVYTLLKDTLGRVGLSCTPGNLKAQIDMFRLRIRRAREAEAGYREGKKRLDSLEKEEVRLAGELDGLSGRIQSILDQAGSSSTEEFRAECVKCRRVLELRERESSLGRESLRVGGERSLDDWREHARELEESLARGCGVPAESAGSGPARMLPYLPSPREAEQEARRLAGSLGSAREELARIGERIRQAFRNYRTPGEVEEDIAHAGRQAQQLQRNRKALSAAALAIRDLSRLQQEATAPRLNQAVASRFLRLCADRYSEVKIDPDFQVRVREAATGELRPAEGLSRGTQDQLYFALRFGILDLLGHADEPCPCLLDEPFAAYDCTRIEGAFRILDEEAGRRQIFVFTCREDVRDLALRHGAQICELPPT